MAIHAATPSEDESIASRISSQVVHYKQVAVTEPLENMPSNAMYSTKAADEEGSPRSIAAGPMDSRLHTIPELEDSTAKKRGGSILNGSSMSPQKRRRVTFAPDVKTHDAASPALTNKKKMRRIGSSTFISTTIPMSNLLEKLKSRHGIGYKPQNTLHSVQCRKRRKGSSKAKSSLVPQDAISMMEDVNDLVYDGNKSLRALEKEAFNQGLLMDTDDAVDTNGKATSPKRMENTIADKMEALQIKEQQMPATEKQSEAAPLYPVQNKIAGLSSIASAVNFLGEQEETEGNSSLS